MITAVIITRKRGYHIIPSRARTTWRNASPAAASRSSEDTLVEPDDQLYASESDDSLLRHPSPHPSKRSPSRVRGAAQTGPYRNHVHSRILQKFPFLIEMFYWGLNYVAYLLSKDAAAAFHGQKGNAVVELAQKHGIDILDFEHESAFSFLFLQEISVQKFFLQKHVGIMSVLNQIYSLVHIPGTVAYVPRVQSPVSPRQLI